MALFFCLNSQLSKGGAHSTENPTNRFYQCGVVAQTTTIQRRKTAAAKIRVIISMEESIYIVGCYKDCSSRKVPNGRGKRFTYYPLEAVIQYQPKPVDFAISFIG